MFERPEEEIVVESEDVRPADVIQDGAVEEAELEDLADGE